MASERGRWILLAAVLLGGCRADVIVPDDAPPEPIAEGYESYEPWAPSIRVIGADGSERPWSSVFLSNFMYYTGFDSLDQVRQGDRFFGPNRVGTVEPIFPPFVAGVELAGPEGVSVVLVDQIPMPGETIVVDLRESVPRTVRVEVRGDDPPPVVDVSVQAWFRTSIPSTRDTTHERVFAAVDSRDGLNGQVVSWPSTPGFVRFERVRVEWEVEQGAVLSRRDFTMPAEALPAEPLPTELDVVVDPSTVFLQVLRRGRPVRDQRFQVWADTRSADGSLLESFLRVERTAGEFRLGTLAPELELRIDPIEQISWMVPRDLDVAAAPGDTVTVELGRFDLDVEVVDAAGDPFPAAWIRIHVPGHEGRGQGVTGPGGLARFAVEPGVIDVEVQPTQYDDENRVERRVRVTEDTLVRVQLR